MSDSAPNRLPFVGTVNVSVRAMIALVVLVSSNLVGPSVNVAAATNGQTIWSAATPKVLVAASRASIVLGTRFTVARPGKAVAIRFYRNKANAGKRVGYLWDATGKELARVTFSSQTKVGWVEAKLSTAKDLVPGKQYVVGYRAPHGRHAYARNVFGAGRTLVSGDLTALAGVYSTAGKFPTSTRTGTAYFVDLRFQRTPVVGHTGGTPTPPVPSPSAPTPSSPSPSVTVPSSPSPSATVPSSSPSPSATVPTANPSSPTSTLNCVAKPSGCGYPDASNTGVAAGVVLKRVPEDVKSGTGWTWDSRGWINAGSGAVVEGVTFAGSVEVTGTNVVVRNNRLTVSGESWAVGLRHASNATIQNNDIVPSGTRLMAGIKDIYGDSSNTRIIANDISFTATGVQISQGLIEGNYIHDLGMVSGDHVNGTTSNGGTAQLTIRRNTVLNRFSQTDAISLFQDFGLEANRLITGNLVAGGGYAIYGGDNRNFGRTYNIKITDNRFSTIYYPNSGYYGPYTAYDPAGSGNEFSGNVWDNTGQPVR